MTPAGSLRETLPRSATCRRNQEMPNWMTVEYFMAYLKPFYPNWDDQHATALLRQFELPPDRKLRHLSHGMRMKAALASSLAYHPRLLVLDEPFTGLDPLVRDELIEGVLENAEGATILISSHDLTEIESFASHIGYLDRGRLQFSEEMATLSDRFREVEITLQSSSPPSVPWPVTWVNAQQSAAVVRFVETQFEQDRTMRKSGGCSGSSAHRGEPDASAGDFRDAGKGRQKGGIGTCGRQFISSRKTCASLAGDYGDAVGRCHLRLCRRRPGAMDD